MNPNETRSWKWIGIAAAVAGAWVFISMLPDIKRYLKIESM